MELKVKKIIFSLLLISSLAYVYLANDGSNAYNHGLDAYNHGNYKKAAELFKKVANQGDAQAQYQLGAMYDRGQGVKQDYKKAEKLWEKAADQGNAHAQHDLDVMYDN